MLRSASDELRPEQAHCEVAKSQPEAYWQDGEVASRIFKRKRVELVCCFKWDLKLTTDTGFSLSSKWLCQLPSSLPKHNDLQGTALHCSASVCPKMCYWKSSHVRLQQELTEGPMSSVEEFGRFKIGRYNRQTVYKLFIVCVCAQHIQYIVFKAIRSLEVLKQ